MVTGSQHRCGRGDLGSPAACGAGLVGLPAYCAPLLADDRVLARLDAYVALLRRWNRVFNLVGASSPQALFDRHVCDCLAVLARLPQEGGSLLDIGSGAGLPGLVLAIARPGISVTLAEPRAKRQAFLRQAVRDLELANVRVAGERLRADDAAQRARLGVFDCVTSRAFAGLAAFLDLALAYCRPGGRIIAMKGPAAASELAAWRARGGALPASILPYRLADGSSRCLVVVEKPG